MQNTNAYVASEEREEIANEGKAAQQLEQILASGLPPLYRRAYRILGNAADAEDAVQDALLAAFTSALGRSHCSVSSKIVAPQIAGACCDSGSGNLVLLCAASCKSIQGCPVSGNCF